METDKMEENDKTGEECVIRDYYKLNAHIHLQKQNED
jgi:hypothetical protein